MISGQSKLKPLVANIALQHVKATEAANPKTKKQTGEFGIENFLCC